MGLFDESTFPGYEFVDALGGHDSRLWLELFIQADKINHDFQARLQYLRNTGCRLEENEKFGYVIVPIIDSDHWKSQEQYDEEKRCLIPFRTEIVNLLRWLKTWKTSKSNS